MRILIPVDGSAYSTAAVAFVASRSTLIGAQPEVELLNAQLPIPPRAARAVGRELVATFHEAEAQAVLKPALALLRKAGLHAQARHEVGSPGATVAAAAAGGGADLVVMGSHGHSAFKGLVFGSVTNAVLAGCLTPLLVVRGTRAPARDSLTVGIALDGSAYGLAAIRYVVQHRELFGTQPTLHLIHVVPDLFSVVIPGLGDAPAPLYSTEKVLAAQSAAFEKALAPARRLLAKAGLAATEACLTGNNAGDEIAAYAKKKRLDLLVMGSHGFGLLKSAVLGSVATRVAARCDTPLLLIRAASRR
ncbi:MAG: universal stress protein [Burkholderiaceae bacterium]|jgi:nucleotide-binding universal stress UspA family protein|nr:universal stress protein [Burkholderiaceae bacterium]